MSSTIQAFIFDMDGTIVDSMPAHARSWELFAQRHPVDMTVDEILRRTTGLTGVECIRELFGPQVEEERALALVAEKEALYREVFAASFREVPGFTRFLARAQAAGIRTAIATAGDRHNIAFVLERLALPRPPEAIVGGDQGLPGKPDPALFLEAARLLQVPPERCLVFEDAPFGIEAARRGGMRAAALCTTHSARELEGDHVIASAADYLAWAEEPGWSRLLGT